MLNFLKESVFSMSSEKKQVLKRSKRMLKLFNAFQGVSVSKAPGSVPPFSKWLDGKLLHAKRGEIDVQYDLRPEMANPTGLLHGGMHGALIDDAIGWCQATLGYEGFLITIDLHLNYLGKVKIKQSVIVKVRLVREGRNIMHFHAQTFDLDGKLITTGNANLLKTNFTPNYIQELDKQ